MVVGQHVAAGDVLATASTTGINRQIAVASAQVADDKTRVSNGGTTLQVANAYLALFNAETALDNLVAERDHASLVASEAGVVTAVTSARTRSRRMARPSSWRRTRWWRRRS